LRSGYLVWEEIDEFFIKLPIKILTGKKEGSPGEGIFARRQRLLQRSSDKTKSIFKTNKAYKFFFLQEWIVLGNIIGMV